MGGCKGEGSTSCPVAWPFPRMRAKTDKPGGQQRAFHQEAITAWEAMITYTRPLAHPPPWVTTVPVKTAPSLQRGAGAGAMSASGRLSVTVSAGTDLVPS